MLYRRGDHKPSCHPVSAVSVQRNEMWGQSQVRSSVNDC